ncbi:carbohydrate kinase family protein [Streptomyces achromogenes]|uniref:carbohydrate kinase family protein n=1 Tax=Streptomyces achromogenes TaxID=67255 RepID=UPI0036BDCE6E
MTRLSIVGNVSRDRTTYPDGRRSDLLGGAALHTALAAVRSGAHAGLVSVIGQDLAGLPHAGLHPRLDWSGVRISQGNSAAFTLTYDENDALRSVQPDYGAAADLTAHAVTRIRDRVGDFFHLSLRRPLEPAPVLTALTCQRAGFSADFFISSAPEMIRDAAPWLPRAAVVFTNAVEYEHLAASVDPDTLALVAVTDGPRPARLLWRGRTIVRARPPAATATEVTGAGDTFAGTFLAHWLDGLPSRQVLTSAVHAATEHLGAPPLPIPAQFRS